MRVGKVGEHGWRQEYDEEIDDEHEAEVANVVAQSVPSKLKATIKFGYEEGLKAELGDNFDTWLSSVFTHTQAYFKHSESLGTEIHFEVSTFL